MRYADIKSNLQEAPMQDFAVVGDPTTPGSFRADDLRASSNPKWLQKLNIVFAKTPFQFNVYLFNALDSKIDFTQSPHVHDTVAATLDNIRAYSGVHDITRLERLIGRPIPQGAESVTILLTLNEGDERFVLTPWMVAHRVVHALFAAGDASYRKSTLGQTGLVQPVFSTLNFMTREITSFFKHKLGQDIEQLAIPPLIGKMRSARDNKIVRYGEFYVDLVTQYLVQGAISFRHPDVNTNGRAPPLDPALDAQLVALYQTNPYKSAFVQSALAATFKRPVTEPRTQYQAFDKTGKMVAAAGDDRLASPWLSRGLEVRVKEPSKPMLRRWERYQAATQTLERTFDAYEHLGLWPKQMTINDQFDALLDSLAVRLNDACGAMFAGSVGKAFVL